MAGVHIRRKLAAEELLAAVQRLPADELREFEQSYRIWKRANGNGTNHSEEADLLARIRQYSSLPVSDQRRFDRLRRKRQAEELNKHEEKELRTLWRRVEQMNVARLRALTKLARLRGTHVKALMRSLGISENLHVF